MLFKLLKYLIIVAITIVALFLGLVLSIDQEKFIQKINDKIRSDFGKEIQYDHEIELNFFPFPQIKLKSIKYFDRILNLDLKVKELSLTSSWRSILVLDPEIKNLHLFEPELNISQKKVAKTRFILVNNPKDSFTDIQNLAKKFKKVIIEDGVLTFDQAVLFMNLKI